MKPRRHGRHRRAWLASHASHLATFGMVLRGLRQPDAWKAALFASSLSRGAVCYAPGAWRF